MKNGWHRSRVNQFIKACKLVFAISKFSTQPLIIMGLFWFVLPFSSFWWFYCGFGYFQVIFRWKWMSSVSPTKIFVFIMIIRHFLSQYQAEDIINIGGFRISKITVCLCQGLTSKCLYQNFFQSVSLAQNQSRSVYRLKFGFIYGVSLISIHSRKYVP